MTMLLFESARSGTQDRAIMAWIDDLWRRLRFHVAEPRRWSGLLRRVMLARAIRGSNSIEGFEVSLEDAFAALDEEEPMEATEEAWAAVRGYRNAMTYVLQMAKDESFVLSADTIKALHFMMQSYDLSKWPGRWRQGDIYVIDEDNQVRVYTGPDSELVPGLIDAFVEETNRSSDLPTLARSAMAHLNFVMIHPFKDGNGRMARCLQTLLLAREGVSAPEFCSIEEYLGRNEQDYYKVLLEVGGGSWNPQRDTGPWIRFCLTAHFRQALTVQRRSKLAERLWYLAETEIANAHLQDRSIGPLFYTLFGRRLRNSSYRQVTEDGVSQNLASRDLTEMVRSGLLEPRGERRGRFYLPAPRLRETASQVIDEARRAYPVDADPYQLPVADQPALW